MMMRVTWPWRVSTRRPGHVEWKGRVQHTHNDEGEKRGKNNNEAPRLMPLPLPPPACRQQRPSYTTCNVTNPSTPSFLVFMVLMLYRGLDLCNPITPTCPLQRVVSPHHPRRGYWTRRGWRRWGGAARLAPMSGISTWCRTAAGTTR